MVQREIIDVRASQPSRDGDGVAIQRIALMGDPGTDPVLLIDELRSPYREDFAGGFPPHPHRGMQTLTYMKDGGIIHEDSMGNRGEIRSGGAQWMSAGSGVIHSEMPTQDTQGLHGFQLWFNLPAAEKMAPPRYRDIPTRELTHHQGNGFQATAIAGEWRLNQECIEGPLRELVPQASLLDLELEPNAQVVISLAASDTAIGYLYDGGVYRGSGHEGGVKDQEVGATQARVDAGQLMITGEGDQWQISGTSSGARILLMTGRPICEPVVGYGPFVMNSRAEIEQAIRDYQSGTLVQAH